MISNYVSYIKLFQSVSIISSCIKWYQWNHERWFKICACATCVFFGMAPPKCKCCLIRDATELETAHLQKVWAWEQGLKWDFFQGLAYWFLCESCHRDTWVTDFRVKGIHSKPGWMRWSRTGKGARAKTMVGDFYLTEPVPEFLRPDSGPSVVPEPLCKSRRQFFLHFQAFEISEIGRDFHFFDI